MKKLQIGLQLYSIKEALEKDFAGTIKAVGKMGYDLVEFAGLYGHSAQQVKEICAEAGVKPISAHVGLGVIINDIDGVIKTYHNIGCKYIVIPWIDEEMLVGSEKYSQLLKDIDAIADIAKKYNMVLCYHNHDFEFKKVNGKNKLDILYEDTDPSVLQTQIDTCWAKVGGEDPAEYIKKYSGRAPLVHIKDFVGGKSSKMYDLIDGGVVAESDKTLENVKFEFRPVGYGVQDVKSIIAASIDAGAEAVIVEQDSASDSLGKSSIECAKISVNFIKSL